MPKLPFASPSQPPKLKFCGINDRRSLAFCIDNSVDYVGFVNFPQSPRHIESSRIAESINFIKNTAKCNTKSVLLTVDMPFIELEALLKQTKPDLIQLHGDESPQYCEKIKRNFGNIAIIKAFAINDQQDTLLYRDYSSLIDYILFDAKAKQGYSGGHGIKFNWDMLASGVLTKPLFLAGGININNINQAITNIAPYCLDISSAIETTKGVKSIAKMTTIINTIKEQ